jgi:hypothetical protein
MRRPVVVATSTVSSRAVCQANMPSDSHANVVTGTTYPVPPASRANFQVASQPLPWPHLAATHDQGQD